jgi:hypothetical protein
MVNLAMLANFAKIDPVEELAIKTRQGDTKRSLDRINLGIGDLMVTEVLEGFRSNTAYNTAILVLVDCQFLKSSGRSEHLKQRKTIDFFARKV